MKQNIKKPNGFVKCTFYNRQTGRQVKQRKRLLHYDKKKEYLTGSRSRPIPLYSIAIYNLIIKA